MHDVDPHVDTVDCDRRLDDLDRLTELWRQQADMWSARVEIVEGRAAAVATAAAALGTLIVTQAEALSVANTRATIAFWLLTAAAGLSFFARVLPRGHWIAAAKELLSSTEGAAKELLSSTEGAKEKGRWSRALRQARTFSQQRVDARLDALRNIRDNMADEVPESAIVRRALRDFWQARADSSHSAYDAKAVLVGVAATSLACALISLAFAARSILAS